MSDTAHSENATAGFTLIEVLVALAILSVSIMSIGSLVAANMRGVGALREHLALNSVARAIEGGLPSSWPNQSGALTGKTDGHAWRVEVAPFSERGSALRPSPIWVPEKVAITVTSPNGARLRLDTIRLRRSQQ